MKLARTYHAFTAALLMLMLLIGGTACRRVDNVVWADFEPLDDNGWDPIRICSFSPWPVDSVVSPEDKFTLAVGCRFRASHHPAKLHLGVRLLDEEHMILSDTMTLLLTPPPDGPGGRGAYAVYEVLDTLKRDLTLSPGLLLEIQNLTVPEQTRGVIAVGGRLSLTNHSALSWTERLGIPREWLLHFNNQ